MPTTYENTYRPLADFATLETAANIWTREIANAAEIRHETYVEERIKDQLTEEIGMKVFNALKKIIQMNVSEQEFMDVLMGE